MEFGVDLSDEERMQLGKTVSDFKSYSENSLAQMGGMLADADLVLNKDYVVVGDPMNGEQISNTLALQNINGANPRSFDPDAKTSRTLTTKGNQNVVNCLNVNWPLLYRFIMLGDIYKTVLTL